MAGATGGLVVEIKLYVVGTISDQASGVRQETSLEVELVGGGGVGDRRIEE